MIETQITPDEVIALPAGFAVRPAEMADLENAVAMYNRADQEHNKDSYMTVETVRTEWTSPQMNLQDQTVVILNQDDEIVGYGEIWNNDSPHRAWAWSRVDPVHKNHGIGTYLMQWGEQRARQDIARCEPDVEVLMWVSCKDDDEHSQQLFLDNGFSVVRYFSCYGTELTEKPTVRSVANDIVFRDYKHPNDLRETVRVDLESFRDHWGFSEPPFEKMVAEMAHEIDDDAQVDTNLWQLAIDSRTNQIVGVALNRLQAYDQPDYGYIMTLGVLREYRQKGIATALLNRSFLEFWERGIRKVSLHTDSESLTGATRLYENAGMKPLSRTVRYQKVLREGVSVITTELES